MGLGPSTAFSTQCVNDNRQPSCIYGTEGVMPHIKIKDQRDNKVVIHYSEPYEDPDTGFQIDGYVQVVSDEGAVLTDKEIGQVQSALATARKRAYPRLRN